MNSLIAKSSSRLQDMGLEIKRMAQLEKQAGALTAGVEKANEAVLQLDQVRAELNAALEQLNNEQFAGELRAQLESLTAERDVLRYDSGARHQLQRQFQT